MSLRSRNSSPPVASRLPDYKSDPAQGSQRLQFAAVLFQFVALGLFGAAAILIIQAGRDTTFNYDEWDFVQGSRVGGLEVLLAPHNGHLSIVPILVYRVLFAFNGLTQYTPFRVTSLALHLTCCFVFFRLARRRVERIPALLMTSLLLFLGTSWQELLWPFQLAWLISIAAGLLTFLVLDRQSRAGNLTSALALVVSVGSSGLGIPFVVATTVRILADPNRWKMIWIVLPASFLYGSWYLAYGVSQVKISNLPHTSVYVIRSAAGALGGATGVGTDWGMLLLAVAVGLLSLRLVQTTLSPWMAAFVALAGTFWTLLALARADFGDADANRYIYPGALFCLLITAEALQTVSIRMEFLAAASVLTAGAVVLNVIALSSGGIQLRNSATRVRAELAAVELAGSVVQSDFLPDSLLMPQVTAGPYLSAVAALGSPADSLGDVQRSSESTRTAADDVLQRAERLGLTRASSALVPGPHPSIDDARVTARQDGSCLIVNVTSGGATLTSPPGGLTFSSESPIHVQLRRFADAYDVPAVPVYDGGPNYLLKLGLDRSAIPWHVKVLASGPVRICGLG